MLPSLFDLPGMPLDWPKEEPQQEGDTESQETKQSQALADKTIAEKLREPKP